ncbi:MAG TPA: hypothetical protein VIJ25_00005, partial [Methylococcales bacterium]
MDANRMISTDDQNTLAPKNTSGLRSPGLLAKRPMIGLILFIFGTLLFGALTVNLFANGPLLTWDKTIANTLPAIGLKSPPYTKTIIDTGFYVGDQVI